MFWSESELILAIRLYCQLQFGQLHDKNPFIIKLADVLGRTSGSVAMKLCNLASLDPEIVNSGRAGLKNASNLDREVWNAFHQDWEGLFMRSEEILKHYNFEIEEKDDYSAGTRDVTTKARIGQDFFRKMILVNYGKCAVCGIDHNDLLIASHILPWSEYPKSRLDPRNGLCLCNLHDQAFDRNLLLVGADYNITLSDELRQFKNKDWFAEYFGRYQERQINLPEKFYPNREFLEKKFSTTNNTNLHE
ncbi:MAG: HNH endonuclease [Vallitaleaceae bacterium]|nr:HNH endonuclease [Vallitaleaceae bacterium]